MKQKKQYTIAIGIITNNKGEILLTKRHNPHSKYSHGKWQLPGGGIEFGEHPYETLLREIQEETGIQVQKTTEHPLIFSHVFQEVNHHVLIFAFPAKHRKGTLDVSKDPHTKEAKWYTYETIDFSQTLPLTREIIEAASKSIT